MKRWQAFDLHADKTFSNVIVNTNYEVKWFGRTLETFATLDEATAYKSGLLNPTHVEVIENIQRETLPVNTGQAVCAVTPLQLFDEGATLLRTRGFWDVTLSLGSRRTTVATFSFGLTFLPVKVVYTITEERDGNNSSDVFYKYELNSVDNIPDVLLDDVGWHVYESFARIVGGSVQHDPPFDSKSKRRIPPNSALCAVCGFSFAGNEQTNVALTFGARARMLIAS